MTDESLNQRLSRINTYWTMICQAHQGEGDAIFAAQQQLLERYSKAVEDSFAVAIRRTRMRAALTAIGTMMIFGAVTFVLWQGAQDIRINEVD